VNKYVINVFSLDGFYPNAFLGYLKLSELLTFLVYALDRVYSK